MRRYQKLPILLFFAFAAVFAQSRRITPLGASGKRVALVIGNDDYTALRRLHNAANDAKSVTAELEHSGFKVIVITNGTRETMDAAVDQFIAAIQKGDVALFYYCGHAIQIGGENYLAPINLQALNEVQARNRSIKASEVLEQMESRSADLQIVILDASRDSSFGSGRSFGGPGLAAMNAGGGTMLAYATAPGRTADDHAKGSNGLYATYLLQALKEPGTRLLDVFNRAGELVERNSGGKQIPWISSSVRGEFYFHDRRSTTGAPVTVDLDLERYSAVKDSMDPVQLESVAKDLKRADLARTLQARAKELRSAVAPAPQVLDSATAKARAQGALKKRDFETAEQLLLPLARNGDAWGETKMAELYMLGTGIGRDYQGAAKLIQSAANQGDTRAMALMAHLLCEGDGLLIEDAINVGEWMTLRKDNVAALNWAKKSADAGDGLGFAALGDLYYYGTGVPKDSRQALDWYRKSAEAGEPVGMRKLAFSLMAGEGTTKNAVMALEWYQRAGAMGDAIAFVNLGVFYNTDQGGHRDPAKAGEYFKRAADLGSGRGMLSLAFCYFDGTCMPKNRKEAVRWWRASANRGNTKAMINLGYAYEQGEGGLKADYGAARALYEQAVREGDFTARDQILRLNLLERK